MAVPAETLQKYEMTIGIECHVQLATDTKLFSSADNDARDAAPNTKVHPIDFGLPGMLPVLNRRAVDLAIRAGKALNAPIANVSRFDRKHYFYPDLPKGYQTSQMYQPIILAGYVDAPLEDGAVKRVRIEHAHMEEDAGKLTHHDDYSLVDLNRAGTPLIEIVSEPDMHSAAEARAYATELYRLMTYAGVTYGDLYHGNMRFDVNISIAPKGSTTLGKRAEVKNLNSFRSVEHAAQYEFERQVALVEAGDPVVQETRGWNDDRGITTSQRSKEDAQDYRYMPDPDIPPIVLTDEEIADIQAGMPMLPGEYRESWSGLSLDKSVVDTILGHQEVANLLQQTYRLADSDQGGVLSELGVDKQVYAALMRRIFNWFASTPDEMIDLARIRSGLVEPRRLVHLALLAEKNEISSNNAKEIFLFLFDESFAGKMPRDIAKEKNLLQVSDESAITAIVDDVMNDPASAASIADIKAGKDKAIGYLVGQVMKRSKGQANPSLAQKLIRERL